MVKVFLLSEKRDKSFNDKDILWRLYLVIKKALKNYNGSATLILTANFNYCN